MVPKICNDNEGLKWALKFFLNKRLTVQYRFFFNGVRW